MEPHRVHKGHPKGAKMHKKNELGGAMGTCWSTKGAKVVPGTDFNGFGGTPWTPKLKKNDETEYRFPSAFSNTL